MSRFGGAQKCRLCQKSVYMAEEVKADGGSFHKNCFKCSKCNRSLDSQNMAVSEGALFCGACHRKIHDVHKLAQSTGGSSTLGGENACGRCDKPVYLAEKVVGAGKKWHKGCFTCIDCNKLLDSTTVSDKDGEIYCKGCYGSRFAPKGYGYGGGAGALTRTQ